MSRSVYSQVQVQVRLLKLGVSRAPSQPHLGWEGCKIIFSGSREHILRVTAYVAGYVAK